MSYFLNHIELFVSLIFGVLGLIIFIITFIRTGSIKKSFNNFCEVNDLKYKTYSLHLKNGTKGQEFSEFVDDYVLNPDTNELEVLPNKKNIQAYIQSYLDTALDKALEKFMPNVVQEVDDVADYQNAVQDLSLLAEGIEQAELYREKFNLPDNYSVAQIYEYLDKYSKSLKEKMLKQSKNGGSESDVKKEQDAS